MIWTTCFLVRLYIYLFIYLSIHSVSQSLGHSFIYSLPINFEKYNALMGPCPHRGKAGFIYGAYQKDVIHYQRPIVLQSNENVWHFSKEQLILFPLVPFLHHVCHA